MALRVRFPVVDQRVLFSANSGAPRDAVRRHFAQVVRREIARVDAENAAALGAPVSHETFVDGAASTALDSVRYGGTIEARWRLGAGVVGYIVDLLRGAGPVRSGRYRASARVFIDGVETSDLSKANGAREVMIVAGVPYARKIERGRDRYSPGNVYQAAAKMAAARYSNVARIRFTFAAGVEVTRGLSRADREAIRRARQPAILVFL